MPNELLIKAMTYNHPETIPVGFGILPAVFMKHGDKVKKILAKHEDMLGDWWLNYDPYANLGESYKKGGYTDPWGCVWSNEYEGMAAIVTKHPVPAREDVHTMKLPEGDAGLPHGFMYLRLLDLRGFEEVMVDFIEEPPELRMLIDKVLGYNLGQTKKMLENNKDNLIFFGDDLGMQKGLAIGPEKWRKYLKPCFSSIYKLCKDDGRLIYMHTDGDISEILTDLQECGVDMVNPQIRACGLDNLERICKGKIPINLDLDRQLFPFCTPKEAREHLEECVKRLYLPQGGLGLNIEIGPCVPLENFEAILEAASEIRHYKG
jgi:hypothetical protein